MTSHALARLAERVPGCDPIALLSRIRVADSRGELVEIAHSLTDRCRITGYAVPNGPYVFPIIAADSAIITVLGEGMETETVTGRVTLARPVKQHMTSGIHQISADAYHSDPAPDPSLSSTLARLILNQSPLHAWTASPRLNPNWQPVEKKTFDIGRAAHRAVLGAGSDFCVIPEDILASNGAASTKEAKAFVEDARAKGLTPLKQAEAVDIEAMRGKIAAKLQLLNIGFDPARSEISALAVINGVWCRAMIDNAPIDPALPLYDFKTTTDASPEACTKAVMNYGYDVQAAHYLEAWKAATGETRLFRFVFQEKTAPFEVCVVELGDDSLAMARKKTARARALWCDCLRSNDWPGYPLGVFKVELPDFYHAKWLERESVDADYKRQTGQDAINRARAWQAPEKFKIAGE